QRFTLTVETSGSGTVTSEPGGISCGAAAGRDCSEPYNQGTVVTLTAAVGNGFIFSGWGGACSGTDVITKVTIDAAKSCKANFTQRFTLSVKKSGTGTVTSDPSGISCGEDCSEPYNQGTQVTLTAEAGPGFRFVGWDDEMCAGESLKITIAMVRDGSCTAFFAKIEFTLTIQKEGTGSGSVNDSPEKDIRCGRDCSQNYDAGSPVTLSASPNSGSEFKGWSGNTCKINANNGLEINANTTCIATFDLVPVPDTLSNISFSPSSPSLLIVNDSVNITFDYQTSEENGVRIWARPFTNDELTSNYSASGSPLHPVGTGAGTQFFTITTTAKVNQVRFQMWTDGQTKLLYETFVDVGYTFGEERCHISQSLTSCL
ncbi:hypothetical protein MNBD_GAMMA16-1333, partial [hydrothermal vent metagenome]